MSTIDTTLVPVAPTTAGPRLPLPVIPESAPFTTAQRAWLNGFLAGMLNTYPAGASAPATSGLVASATMEQTAVAEAPAPAEEVEEEMPWHDPTISIAERLKLAEGKPQSRVLMAAMAQLDCGACGYLCKTYSEAIANGSEKDLTRCTPGGKETSKMLKQLIAAAPPAAAVPAKAATSKVEAKPKSASGASTWDRNNPFPARLRRSVPLNGKGSDKDTRLVEFDLKGSGLTYNVGDALGVYPENCPDLVQEILEALHVSGAEDVTGWDGQPVSLHDALIRDYTITRPTPGLIELMAERAEDAAEREQLIALRDSEDGPDAGTHVLDLLKKFPSAKMKPDDFVARLSPLAPRLYSISSSLSAHPEQVHLTVGTVRYKNNGGRGCKGVASTYMADRVRPGMKVRVFVHPAHKFGLCASDRPIIMVGPGTGIAPFRAFLQERAARKATGKSWLFFGDQKSSTDFLYREELEQYHKAGTLTKLDLAFSRDTDKKVYVQHRMLEQAPELWAWLQNGAHFYVCGDASRMASDVDKALRQVIAEQGGLDAAGVDKYMAELARAGRYQRDVY